MMTFNSFVENILQKTLPFDLHRGCVPPYPAESYLGWIYWTGEGLGSYSTDDFLDMYIEYYDIHEDNHLADYDETLDYKVRKLDQQYLEKDLDISDLNKDRQTFGYSYEMDMMEYDAW